MFTVCSKCNLRLTVTATDLRAAQGYVRCGRCHNVFNALAALADDPASRQAEAEGSAVATQSRPALIAPEAAEPPTPAAEPEPEPASSLAPAADGSATEDAGSIDTSLEFNPASTNINEVFIEAVPGERTGTFETIILVGEEPAAESPAGSLIAPQALSAPLPEAHPGARDAVEVRRMRDALAEPDADRVITFDAFDEPDSAPAALPAAAATPTRLPEPVAPSPVEEPDAIVPASQEPPPLVILPANDPEPLAPAPMEEPAALVAATQEPAPPAHLPADNPQPLASTATAEEPLTPPTVVEEPTATPTVPVAEAEPADAEPPPPQPPEIDTAAARQIGEALHEAAGREVAEEPPAQAAAPATVVVSEEPPADIPQWLPRAAAAVLAVLLIGQLVHHYRGALADTSLLRGPLGALYRGLGAPIEPRWDIASYEIRQLGAGTDGAASGDLVVRASISNRAPRVQPLPLLRVVMQDRFGNRVGARDLTPAEYLGRGAPPVSLIAPGQRVDVQVAFRDPGQAATGFEIDACMAVHGRNVSCANDPGSH